MKYNKDLVVKRIESLAYKLRYRRREGFSDSTLMSGVLINEIKYLYNHLDAKTQKEILNKSWLDQ
jgi:hypothetical protein